MNKLKLITLQSPNYKGKKPHKANRLEGEIRHPELLEALKSMKNLKTPGNDGFTAEFFKSFWIDLKLFILKSLTYAYKSGYKTQ